MGTAKGALAWHGSTLLYRTAALLARTVPGPVVVVAAPGQQLPDLPRGVAVVRDPVEGRGPMQGIAAGLTAVADRAPTAFVCSTDLPFLHPAFVRRVLGLLASSRADLALPVARGFRQPLAAGYRAGLGELIAKLVANGQLRPGMLDEHCAVTAVDDAALLADADLARWDPQLDSLTNINTPDEYTAALGRPLPEVIVQARGSLAGSGRHGGRPVAAATLGAAAAAVGLDLDRHVVATLNGEKIFSDPQLPTVAGDSIAFLPAATGGRIR